LKEKSSTEIYHSTITDYIYLSLFFPKQKKGLPAEKSQPSYIHNSLWKQIKPRLATKNIKNTILSNGHTCK